MVKRLLIFALLLAGAVGSADKTPYPHCFGANTYYGARNVTVTWMAERYDLGVNGISDWEGMFDSIWDTANSWGDTFLCGPYASVHELNLAQAVPIDWSDSTYAARLTNIEYFFPAIYAEVYADSVGMDVESLYVHYDEDTVNITNDGEARGYDVTLLTHKRKRFSYQYWNNNSGDPDMYPAGYAWLANGYNDTTKRSIAYAYRRYFLEDSGTYGRGGNGQWTAFFSDNMYRTGAGPRLYTYYTINYTFGGPSAVMDWIEEDEIQNDATSLQNYYDNSTLEIMNEVRTTLDSMTTADNLPPVLGFGNVDKFNSTHFAVQINKMNCLLENPMDYTKSWARYRNWLQISDIMENRNTGDADQRYLMWLHLADALVNESAWNTGDRIYMAHYCFHMNIYHPNIYVGMNRFNDSTRWRGIYEVDFGSTFRGRTLTDSAGSGDYGDKNYVMQRWIVSDGGTDSTLVLFRSGYGSNFTTDYVTITLPVSLYPIDVNADTSGVAVSSVDLYVYQGWAGTTDAAPSSPPDAGTVYTGKDYKGVDLR